MSSRQQLMITSPVGRLVSGSVHVPQTKDMDGNLLVVKKEGPDKGKPQPRYYFALAIPKNAGEDAWWKTVWGAQIAARGHADFPSGQAGRADFAWKIEDGDSQLPNKKGKKNADREGFPGHWVLRMSSVQQPKTFSMVGKAAGNPPDVVDPTVIRTGFYVQVYFGVDGNDDVTRNPGVYINPYMVSLAAYAPEIVGGPDVSQAGFGAAPLPPGASLTPPASFTAPAPAAAPPGPVAPAPVAPAPVAPVAPAPAPVPVVAAPAAPAVPVQPYTPPSAVPAAPPAPAAPVGPQMTAKAAGVSYEAYRAKGWTDELLRQHGLMV